jgi:hypothetical protein
MKKLRVIFSMKYSRGNGEWQVQAMCPDRVIEYITGFKSGDEAWDWISGPKSKEWAGVRGYSDAP